MADLSLPWGGDLSLDATGDLATVDGAAELQQRVIRRFLTNAVQTDLNGNVTSPPDYIFQPQYGGNARLYVDKNSDEETVQAIQQRLQQQISQEAEVAVTPAPVISVDTKTLPDGIIVNAQVALANGQVIAIPELEVTR